MTRKDVPVGGLRLTLTVKGTRKCPCETVYGTIAEKLDVAEARIVLRDQKGVETMRAQLSSTLELSKEPFPAGKSDLSRIVTQATLGLSVADSTRNHIAEVYVFGDGVDTSDNLSRQELEKVVKERKLARPVHIEKQMANVSKSMEEQLSLLLAKTKREPEQLAQDSLGSVSYSSTDPSMDEGAQTPAVPTTSSLKSSGPAKKVDTGHLRGNQDGEGASSTISECGSIQSEEG